MDQIVTADGVRLQARVWPASANAERVRGQVLLVHGLGEHAGRYEHVAQALCAQGWQVVAYDQRGHGQSGGGRGVIPDRNSLLQDLGRVVDAVRPLQPGPLVMLGHSLGGLVAARYVAEGLHVKPAAWWRPVDALVLSSPALDAGMSLFQKLLVAVGASLVPGLALGNGLKPSWICRDPAVVAAYVADPLVHDRICGRLAKFIADAGPEVQGMAASWRVPTLLMWGGADRCVAPAGSARFAAAAPASVVAQPWPALAHEIFNEPEQAEVLTALNGWLNARYPAAR